MPSQPRHLLRYAVDLATIAMLYFALAKLGLGVFSVVENNVTLIWPPSGLALAALLLYGVRLTPGIALGAFLATASTGAPLTFALGTAISNPLEALCALWLLRWAGFDNRLARIRDVIALVCLAAVIGSIVGATLGVSALCIIGMVPWAAFSAIWPNWWLGDGMGILILTPLLLTWAMSSRLDELSERALEASWLIIGTLVFGNLIFDSWLTRDSDAYPVEYLMFPFLVWAAFRFGPRGTATISALSVSLAVWHTIQGEGPFIRDDLNESLSLLWCFIAVVSIQSLCVAAAVAERIDARRAQQASEDQIRLIIDKVPALISYVDRSRRYRFVNQAFASWHGISGTECHDRRMDEILPEHSSSLYAPHIERALAGKEITAEAVAINADGAQRYMSFTCVPHALENGEVEGVVQVGIDITQRKQEEEALTRAKDAAEEAVRAKSLFLANMSHEIRTPINGMLGMAALLLDTDLSEDQRDFAETLRRSGDSLLALINDILDFSKIEAGRLDLERVSFDLHAAIDDVLELFSETAYSKELELAVLLDRDVPRWIMGDPGRLRQVLTNLVGNALKFTAVGEVVVRVRQTEQSGGGTMIRFEVTDTGIGIAPELQTGLFSPFSQADPSTTRRYGGTGLGLTIAREIVEHMGGQISVTSEPSRGSTFWFVLPVSESSRPYAERSEESARIPSLFKDLEIRALLVSTSALTRTAMRQMLDARAISLESVADERSARERLRSCPNGFDVVLIDHSRPLELDGLELARAVHGDDAMAEIPILLLVPVGRRINVAEMRELGIVGIVRKPLRERALYEGLLLALRIPTEGTIRTVGEVAKAQAKHSLRVLLVEDNPVNQKVAVYMLEREGCRVDTVANGKEALELWAQCHYDMIIMDCQMPVMDGYAATAEIRAREALSGRHTPIIAMTAHALTGDRERCIAVGMDDYVSKPVQAHELTSVLNRWRSGARAAMAQRSPHGPS